MLELSLILSFNINLDFFQRKLDVRFVLMQNVSHRLEFCGKVCKIGISFRAYLHDDFHGTGKVCIKHVKAVRPNRRFVILLQISVLNSRHFYMA